MNTTELLKKTTLFSSLSADELRGVSSTAKRRQFPAGTEIIKEGHPGGRGFYMLLDGRAEVKRGDKLLATFGPGDYFGEMALLLEETPRTASVVAVEDTICLVMTQWDFKALLSSHPELAAKMMTELAKRLRDTDQALSE